MRELDLDIAIAVGVAVALFVSPTIGRVVGRRVIRAWPSSGKWGINRNPAEKCPRCGKALPKVRIPRNLRQLAWGGWTCSGCGCEADKYGTPIK